MIISFSMPQEMAIRGTGFGEAGFNIVTSLQQLGHTVPYQDPTAPVELAFGHPDTWQWSSKSAYRIGYMAWESTAVHERWMKPLQEIDELWVTSPRLKEWMRSWTTKPIYVYEHGVDHKMWKQTKRHRADGVVRYYHQDGAAVRKAAGMTLDAFQDAFKNNEKVELTFKSIHRPTIPSKLPANVKVIKRMMTEEELAWTYRKHHVMVHPVWGEGFGIPPLQAIFTGMPVICSAGWAPYEDLIVNDLLVPTTLSDSPWPELHPGKMYKPDYDELVKNFQKSYSLFERYSSLAFAKSVAAQRKYNWLTLTDTTFQALSKRLGMVD